MIAGLPKLRSLSLVLLLLSFAGVLAVAQDTQTPSLLPVDPVVLPVEQTPSVTLDAITEIIDSNPAITEVVRESLLDAFTAPLEGQLLSIDEALAILAILELDTLDNPAKIDEALAAINLVASDLLAGNLVEDPVAEISDLWAEILTPDGIINSIEKAATRDGLDEATTEALGDRIGDLILNDFPPGILLRVIKDALRDGEDPLEQLAVLEMAAEDGSYGNAANAATENGQFKYQEIEENANQEPNEEPEAEENNHGQGQIGKKTDEDPEEPADADEGEEDSQVEPEDTSSDASDSDTENPKTNNGKGSSKKK